MKSRVLGLACAAGLAAGCQSSAARALSRYQATSDTSDEVAQVSHEAPAGLPAPSRSAARSSPQSPQAMYELGEKALQQFYRDKHDKPVHLQRARVSYEAAAKADPAFAAAQHRLAIVADLQERFHDSESYYRTALSLDPGNANIAADLGWSYILQERWSDAERILQRAVELDPSSTIARDHLARCRQHQAVQVSAGAPAASSQMMANRPAAVGPAPAQGPGGRDPYVTQEMSRSPMVIPEDQMGAYLRHRLAQIDHAGAPPAGQPLFLGPQAQTNFPPQNGGPSPGVVAAAESQAFHQPLMSRAAEGQPAPGVAPAYGDRRAPAPTSDQPYFTHYEPGTPDRHAGPVYTQHPASFSQGMAAGGQPQGGPASVWGDPSGQANPIQRAQALDMAERPYQATHHAPQIPAHAGQPAGGPMATVQRPPGDSQGVPSGAPPIGYGQQPPAHPGAPAEVSPLEKARRDAALMGLGMGPGQPFSSLEQTAYRTSPGSFAHPNGAAFPPPPVYSPDLTPPPDLSQSPSFFEQPPMTPPANSMGQTMPGGTSSMMTPGTINDPNARFQRGGVNPAAAQAPHVPGPTNVWNQSGLQSGLQGYDDARRAADQQVQQTVQSTWAGTPSGAIPSPSSGVPIQRPAAPSQMMTESWDRQPVAPVPYPHAAPPQGYRDSAPVQLPAVNPSPGRLPEGELPNYPPAGRVARPVYREGVVVPEQYGTGR